MLIEISSKIGTLPFLWKTAGLTPELIRTTAPYAVAEDGLRAMKPGKKNVAGEFKVAAAVLKGSMTGGYSSSPVKQLCEEFRKLGVKASTRSYGDGTHMEVQFDVSSKSSQARYEMWTTALSDKPGEWIYAMVYLENTDPAVLGNIRLLDQTLFAIIEKCGFSREH